MPPAQGRDEPLRFTCSNCDHVFPINRPSRGVTEILECYACGKVTVLQLANRPQPEPQSRPTESYSPSMNQGRTTEHHLGSSTRHPSDIRLSDVRSSRENRSRSPDRRDSRSYYRDRSRSRDRRHSPSPQRYRDRSRSRDRLHSPPARRVSRSRYRDRSRSRDRRYSQIHHGDRSRSRDRLHSPPARLVSRSRYRDRSRSPDRRAGAQDSRRHPSASRQPPDRQRVREPQRGHGRPEDHLGQQDESSQHPTGYPDRRRDRPSGKHSGSKSQHPYESRRRSHAKSKKPASAGQQKPNSGAATSLPKTTSNVLLSPSKEGWCYRHHFSGHTTEMCVFTDSLVPDRKKQYFRCEVHESPNSQLSAAHSPRWDEAIKEPKSLEDVLSLLHSVDAWIGDYYDFIQERDTFQFKMLTEFLRDAEGQEEKAVYFRLKELFEHANICSEKLVKSIGAIVKQFYSQSFVPIVRQRIQANLSDWKLDKEKADEILAGSTPITELFSYLPRLYGGRRASKELAAASEPILPADLFPIVQLRKDIKNAFWLYKGAKDEIESQCAEVSLHLLFGRSKHFNRQQVITIMQPAIRDQLNDWIPLPRCPSVDAWVSETQLTQEQLGELEEYLRQNHIQSQAQAQAQPRMASEPAPETAVEPEKVQAPGLRRMLPWQHQTEDLAQIHHSRAPSICSNDEEVVQPAETDITRTEESSPHHSEFSIRLDLMMMDSEV